MTKMVPIKLKIDSHPNLWHMRISLDGIYFLLQSYFIGQDVASPANQESQHSDIFRALLRLIGYVET